MIKQSRVRDYFRNKGMSDEQGEAAFFTKFWYGVKIGEYRLFQTSDGEISVFKPDEKPVGRELSAQEFVRLHYNQLQKAIWNGWVWGVFIEDEILFLYMPSVEDVHIFQSRKVSKKETLDYLREIKEHGR